MLTVELTQKEIEIIIQSLFNQMDITENLKSLSEEEKSKDIEKTQSLINKLANLY